MDTACPSSCEHPPDAKIFAILDKPRKSLKSTLDRYSFVMKAIKGAGNRSLVWQAVEIWELRKEVKALRERLAGKR